MVRVFRCEWSVPGAFLGEAMLAVRLAAGVAYDKTVTSRSNVSLERKEGRKRTA